MIRGPDDRRPNRRKRWQPRDRRGVLKTTLLASIRTPRKELPPPNLYGISSSVQSLLNKERVIQ